ncbi:MAG: MlaD family protein [Phycisphaerales bacterium JB054]
MTDTPTPPAARIARPRRWSWAWLLPLAVVAALVTLGVQASAERPITIVARFAEGHGLRPGDPVACRGVQVGEVREVQLAADAQTVEVHIALDRSAEPIAVEGSRLWVIRPEVSLRRVSGLDAIFGPRTIAIEPGPLGAARQTEFDGLAQAPPLPDPTDGSLLLLLRAERRGSLSPGSPVTYRDISVGQVLAYELAGDATAAELTIAIEPQYAALVRDNTRFFNTSGITADWGIFKGLDVRTDSLESVVTGAIGFATPNKPGARVGAGHTFDLATSPNSDWLGWDPAIPLRDD